MRDLSSTVRWLEKANATDGMLPPDAAKTEHFEAEKLNKLIDE